MSSSGVPRPASSPRRRMSVPPSTRTTASASSVSTRCRYAARSGWTPSFGNAWTVEGRPWRSSQRDSVPSGKYQSRLSVSGVTATTSSPIHASDGRP
ncbi:hypothetical protein ACFQHO_27580 [Actinomadura yumaensis]|uniref:hypothetical protein n=1 Tax=Actinomadura yumaensis TaxID=111807 RepID=UPI003617A30F